MNIEAAYAKNDQPIKNGSIVTSCDKTGHYYHTDTVVSNQPELDTFKSKWSERFHNGILVEVINTNLIGT